MISVVIATLNVEGVLGVVLTPLVTATMDGVVREVVAVDGGSVDDTLEILDDAGATLISAQGSVEARVSQGCAGAKGPWLLILPTDCVLHRGWADQAAAHMAQGTGMAAWFADRPIRWPMRPSAAHHPLLIHRVLYDEAGGFASGSKALIRRLGGKRLRRFDPV
jgi:glycosyltransferase involved in cell wall biosynthesis